MASLIKLDYDISFQEAYALSDERLRFIRDIVGLHHVLGSAKFEESKNGKTHLTFEVEEDLEPLEILAVQLIMGSDPVREAFNLRRIRRGQKNWNILFKPKRRLL